MSIGSNISHSHREGANSLVVQSTHAFNSVRSYRGPNQTNIEGSRRDSIKGVGKLSKMADLALERLGAKKNAQGSSNERGGTQLITNLNMSPMIPGAGWADQAATTNESSLQESLAAAGKLY